jgi:hypothetical protein
MSGAVLFPFLFVELLFFQVAGLTIHTMTVFVCLNDVKRGDWKTLTTRGADFFHIRQGVILTSFFPSDLVALLPVLQTGFTDVFVTIFGIDALGER